MNPQLISAFVFAIWIVQSLYYINLIFQASCQLLWLYSPVCVGPQVGNPVDLLVFLQKVVFCSPEPKAHKVSLKYTSRAAVRPSVCLLTLSNMNILATSWPIGMKFYLQHHWVGGKASVGFDPDWIRTLVSMATDSSHRVIMGKTASSCFLDCF